MDKITIEQILEPVGVANFFKNYWGKKHLVIRRNKFKDLFTWNDFNNCLNKYPYLKGLQIIDYKKEGDGRWCLDKVRNGKLKEMFLNMFVLNLKNILIMVKQMFMLHPRLIQNHFLRMLTAPKTFYSIPKVKLNGQYIKSLLQ